MDTGKLEDKIASQARVCVNHFDQLREDWRSNVVGRLLEEQHARFNLWASNLGVFRTSKVSLDFRLREAPILADTILQLLETVSDNLLTLYHTDKARPLSEDDDPTETARQSLADEANHPRIRHSSSSDDSDSQLQLTQTDSRQVQEVVRREIGAIITRLQRLSVAIRQSTKVGRNLRALDYKGKDVDAKKLLAELERFTESLIRSKFPAMEEELSHRIVATICLRRRRLCYQRDHHAKLYLGKGKTPEKRPITKDPVRPMEAPQKPSDTMAEPVQHSPGNGAAPEQAPTISETKASTIDERKARSLAAKSIKKSQRAKSALQNLKLDFPRPPKPDVNFTEVECPYCQIILSEEEWSDVKVWRQHVIKDLEAYICVLPNCFEPPQMFEAPGSWLNHMRLPHAEKWYCSAPLHESDGPIVFHKEEDFRDHMHHSHPGTFTESQMPSLAHAALRSASPYFSDCPFGDDFPYTESATEGNGLFGAVSLQDHVVGHLKELALLSVPPIENAESDFLSSASGKPEAGPQTLSQDFEDEEEAAVIIFPVNDDYSDDWSEWAHLGCHWAVSAPKTEGLTGETLSSTPTEEVDCFISATLGVIELETEGITIRVGTTDGFEKIEEGARRLLPQGQDGKIYLRHGTFTVTHNSNSDHPQSFSDPLNRSSDWEPCRATLATLTPDTTFSVELDFGVVPVYQPDKDLAYATFIMNALHDKLKPFESGNRMYIPQVDLDAIVTDDAIAKVVDEQEAAMSWTRLTDEREQLSEKSKFISNIRDKARKLFAMYVYFKLTMRSLELLLSTGATDEKPPSIDPNLNPNPQDRRKFDDLVRKQSWFKTFHFGNQESGQHHKVPEGTTVPVSFGKILGSGAYSVVHEAYIDPCHQSFKKYRKSKFAVKVFNAHAGRKMFFEKEYAILTELQNLNPHEHILTHITAWSKGENYYILFPLARMNLREFLKEKQPVADSKLTLWLLRQMNGLADAINWIHNLDNYILETHLQLPDSARQTERKQGYHHDLKPENILLFYPRTDYTEGSLKVSGFGMGKVGRVPPGGQIISRQTSTPSGTLTYESPDFEMHKNIGRPHDMWALGCVLLELLCWLFIAPHSGGKSFQTDRRDPVRSGDSDIIDDSYYYMTTKYEVKTPKLKLVVVKLMFVIEANPSCVDEFRLILDLIRMPGGLLEPDMKRRMSAGTLNNQLKKILQSATERLDTAPDHYAGNVAHSALIGSEGLGLELDLP